MKKATLLYVQYYPTVWTFKLVQGITNPTEKVPSTYCSDLATCLKPFFINYGKSWTKYSFANAHLICTSFSIWTHYCNVYLIPKMAKLFCICNWIFFTISTFSIIKEIASAKTPNWICRQVFPFQTNLKLDLVADPVIQANGRLSFEVFRDG